jgi:16S rRNA (guanine527-N7)-methyltransferase
MSPPAGEAAGDAELVAALVESQRVGMLGDRPIAEVIEHAGAFVLALANVTGTVVDLGSGGGVPGLVIARARPDLRLVLVDRRSSRTDHLQRLVARLGLTDRVEVLTVDAITLGERRAGVADAVVARCFGAPASTLRAAAPLVRLGGLIVVSEPRRALDRWPQALLDELGLVATAPADRRVAVFRRPGAAQTEGGPPSVAGRPNP